MRINPNLKSRLKRQLIKTIEDEKQNRIVIRTPYKLSDEQISRITKSMKASGKTEVVNEVDSDLIGGLVIEKGSKIFDASVKKNIDSAVANLINT